MVTDFMKNKMMGMIYSPQWILFLLMPMVVMDMTIGCTRLSSLLNVEDLIHYEKVTRS